MLKVSGASLSLPPDSSKRINRIWKRRERALARWKTPPASTLPADSTFPLTSYGDLVTDEKAVSTWGEFQEWVESLGPSWSFRGQRIENWRLRPGLERNISRKRTASSKDGKRRLTQVSMFPGAHENSLFQKFKGENPNYINDLAPNNGLDCLALMQHHGAPTRLLDWTFCPHVALFFALRKAERECAVWAIDMDWLERTSNEILYAHDARYPNPGGFDARMKYVNTALFEEHTPWNTHPVVIPLTPAASIERMKAQQGHFLRSLSYEQPFDASLFWMIRSKYEEPWIASRPLRKVIVSPCQSEDILEELRKMGIYYDSLSPGSEFAACLQEELKTRIKKDKRQWVKSVSLMLDRRVAKEDTPK